MSLCDDYSLPVDFVNKRRPASAAAATSTVQWALPSPTVENVSIWSTVNYVKFDTFQVEPVSVRVLRISIFAFYFSPRSLLGNISLTVTGEFRYFNQILFRARRFNKRALFVNRVSVSYLHRRSV